MTTDQLPTEGATESTALEPRPIRGDIITAYEAMLAEVPDAGNEGIEGILEQIATATSATELDEPWRAGGLGKFVDTPLVVTGIRKMPSDFGSGLAFFLVVDGAVRATGEKVAVTTGSVSVVAQLVKAWSLGAFPMAVIPRLSKRPTKDGYYPQHLEIVGT
jgi:hypothetical protein